MTYTSKANERAQAEQILRDAAQHLQDRAVTYDAEGGERSIPKTVDVFNKLTGHSLSEEDGWLFMLCLKLARARQGEFKQDNYEDAAAYTALMAESAAKERS